MKLASYRTTGPAVHVGAIVDDDVLELDAVVRDLPLGTREGEILADKVYSLTSFAFAEYGWPISYGVASGCNENRYGKPTDRRTAPACVEPDIQMVAHRDKRRLD